MGAGSLCLRVLIGSCAIDVLQKLDKELEQALAVLESERNDALKNLDAQVNPCSNPEKLFRW